MANLFKEFYSRLAKEGFIKALLCGLIVGFSVLIVSATAFWFFGVKLIWVSLILFAVSAAISVLLFYRLKFRPTAKAIAERVDELGLEERIITMNQLEGDESYIAMKQREDALKALNTVNAKNIKIAVSIPMVVALSIVGVFGMGMTTAYSLSKKSGQEIIEEITAPIPKQFEVKYEVDGEGFIEGGEEQVVTEGENALPVMAVADDDWVFVEWSDGSTDPYREDLNVSENITVTAIFAEINEGEGEPGDGEDGEGGDPEEAGEDQPSDGDDSGSNGNNEDGFNDGTPGYSSNWEEGNLIIDGQTNLDDVIGEASDRAESETSQNPDLSGGVGDAIGNYFGTIGN